MIKKFSSCAEIQMAPRDATMSFLIALYLFTSQSSSSSVKILSFTDTIEGKMLIEYRKLDRKWKAARLNITLVD